jgi:hypothetical protein
MKQIMFEAGRFTLCLAVLAGFWLVLVVAQSIADRP